MEQEQLEKEQPITDNGVNPRRRVRKQGINDYLTNFVTYGQQKLIRFPF